MYKISSDKRQAALRRGKASLADWLNGEERLNAEEQFRQLKEGVAILEERRNKAFGEEKHLLGIQLREQQYKVGEFRKAFSLVVKAQVPLEHLFMKLAREMLPKAQNDAIYGAAVRLQQQMQKALEAIEAPDPTVPEIKARRRP